MGLFKNIESDSIYKYIGLFVIVLISIFVVAKCFKYQSYLIEGLTNPNNTRINSEYFENLGDHLDEINNTLEHQLAVSDQKTQYEDIIIKLNKNTNLRLLQNESNCANSLVKQDNKNYENYVDENLKLNKFAASLNSSMKYLDTNH